MFNTLQIMILVFSVVAIILLALCIASIVMNAKLKKKLNKFMGGSEKHEELSEILIEFYEHVRSIDKKYSGLVYEMNEIHKRLDICIQKVAMVRYNPFNDMGGDLSFALTLLDADNTGVVINTIYGRDGSQTYCKSIKKGVTEHTLSAEEALSLKKATTRTANA